MTDSVDTTISRDPLGLDIERFRVAGHRVVDLIADHWATLEAGPAVREASPSDLSVLDGPLPRGPADLDGLIDALAEHALSNMQHAAHPRYFARVPSPASLSAILGEWLASGFNAIAASWAGGSGPSQLELTAVEWLRELMGFPEGSEGVLVSGGSLGNITALAAARSAGYTGAVYVSDQTHSSVLRALRMIGVAEDQIRVVPATDRHRWSVAAVTEAIGTEDRGRGIVVATAGSTNTGAVDPLAAIAEICATRDLWFHVDGAYGAPAALTLAGRAVLDGMQQADSLTVDPHKWLFQPYDIGCVLVRRPGVLEACFTMNPEYLRDVRSTDASQVDLRNRSPELTRRARAAKLWLTLAVHGVDAFASAIARSIGLAEEVQRLIERDRGWELVTPAQLGVITFVAPDLDGAEHERRARALTAGGFAAVSCTELSGRTVFRLCMINPLTTLGDVAETLARLQAG